MSQPTQEQSEWMKLAYRAGMDRAEVAEVIRWSMLTGKSPTDVKNIINDSEVFALKGERAYDNQFLADMDKVADMPEGGTYFKPGSENDKA